MSSSSTSVVPKFSLIVVIILAALASSSSWTLSSLSKMVLRKSLASLRGLTGSIISNTENSTVKFSFLTVLTIASNFSLSKNTCVWLSPWIILQYCITVSLLILSFSLLVIMPNNAFHASEWELTPKPLVSLSRICSAFNPSTFVVFDNPKRIMR